MSLLRALSYYTLTAALNNALPFLLLPLLTRCLAPSDYGIIATISAYLAMVAPMVLFGVPTLVGIEYFQLPAEELRRRVAAWCLVPVLASVALTSVLLVARNFVAAATHLPANWIPLLPAAALLGLLPQTLSMLLRMANRPREFSVFEVAQSALQALLTISLVCGLLLGWRGRIYALLAGGTLASLVAAAVMLRYWPRGPMQRQPLVEITKFGLSLMPHSVLSQLIRISDRLLVATLLGMIAAGQYAIAAQIAGVMLIMLSTFNQAWTPYLFERLRLPSDSDKRQLVSLSYRIMGGIVVLALLTNVGAHVLYRTVIDARYATSERFVPWLTAGYVFLGAYLLSTNYLFFAKRVRQLSALTALNAIIGVAAGLTFMSRYGAIGAAYGFAFANLLTAVLTWVLSNKVYPMPWFNWWRT